MKKSKTRLFIKKTISSNLLLYIKDKQHHFLKNVLRVKINDIVNIFDGISGEWTSKVISINRDNIVLKVIDNNKKMKKSQDVWLVFSPIKQYRMNIAIQKATELGVSKIIPCITDFSNVRRINIKNLRDNAIESSEQSERLDIPDISQTTDLNSLLSSWPEERKLIYCDEKIEKGKLMIDELISCKNNVNSWAVLIGPEGGFSDKEKELISGCKSVLSVSLGNTVLRSDTAITVSLFCINQLLTN